MKIKNNTGQVGTWAGQLIEPGEYYSIFLSELFRWQNDSSVLTGIASGDLIMNNETMDITDVATAINYLKQVDSSPRDSEGAKINRPKATYSGWSFQLHNLEFKTSTLNGIYNKDYQGNDLGFATIKLFNASDEEITNQSSADTSCVKTQIDWVVNHEMEIIGGSLNQSAPPVTDVRVWVLAAPGIANIVFAQGGINLKHAGLGKTVTADGRAGKYMHPTQPVPGVNKFRIILKHDAGIKHEASFLFELFKP